ncbi:MAG: U32 family peptidase [Bacteroidales bacterium]|nr:U32 family peptidase [Bacteroidales bacterium]
MRELELLAPARNLSVGIAAIDCGADSVYIAGPEFGARQAAGNSVEDIRELASYAHRYGVRVFVTVNTILYDDELGKASRLLRELAGAGVDAFIVQDMAVIELCRDLGIKVPLHASTQCAIRTPEKARFLASCGFSRLILERELSLAGVRDIVSAVPDREIEFFVHGALCVCYSGQCYLSESITGRSANRGACAQACRSRYDLMDREGNLLIRDKALLSLKDYNLIGRLGELAGAGVTSFKIEGRLKNESYVRNVVRAYSEALDRLVAESGDIYRRASFGRVEKAFEPVLDKTFNRGYTELFLDGKRGFWASMESAKGMGEMVGTVESVSGDKSSFRLAAREGVRLANGDGLSFVSRRGETVGFRADVCDGNVVRTKPVPELYAGAVVFRNLDVAFEKELARNPGQRMIPVSVNLRVKDGNLYVEAASEDGRTVAKTYVLDAGTAENVDRMGSLVKSQLEKTSSIYRFSLTSIEYDRMPFMASSFLNSVRRDIAGELDSTSPVARPLATAEAGPLAAGTLPETSYKANVSNRLSEGFYRKMGAAVIEPAFELGHNPKAELMRTKYCVRYELGLCPKQSSAARSPLLPKGPVAPGPLYLLNNGRRFRLSFDCACCEMTLSASPTTFPSAR